MTSSLAKSVAKGMTWTGISKITNQGFRLLNMVILARLLLPEDFGIVAMALAVTFIGYGVLDMGLTEALIQRKEINDKQLSSIFWLVLCMGILLSIITVSASPIIAKYYGDEQVGPVLAVSSITFIISSLGSVHGAILRKKMDFFRFSMTEASGSVTYLIVSVVLALSGFGVWSIVVGALANDLTYVILRWVVCRWRPSFVLSFNSLKDIYKFGLNITGTKIIGVLIERMDYLIIGRFLTASAVGLYNIANRVTRLPLETMLFNVSRVSFPAFSLIQDDDERLRIGFLKNTACIVIIGLPMFAGLAIVGPELIPVVFGNKWIPAIVPMQLLCIWAVFRILGMVSRPLILSKGRSDIAIKLSILRLILIVGFLLIGVRYEANGVAISLSAAAAIMWPAEQIIANRLSGLKMKDYLMAIYPAALGCVIMAAVLLGVRYIAINFLTLPDIVLLAISIVIGAIVYFITLKINRTEVLDEMINLIREMATPYLKTILMKMRILKSSVPNAIEKEKTGKGSNINV